MTTILQPNKKVSTLWYGLLSLFIIGLIGSATYLVVVLNQAVNGEHELRRAEENLHNIKVEIADLKDQVFSLVSGDRLESLARARGLVLEKDPAYLEVNLHRAWEIASR